MCTFSKKTLPLFPQKRRCKCAVVGSPGVGKTTLIDACKQHHAQTFASTAEVGSAPLPSGEATAVDEREGCLVEVVVSPWVVQLALVESVGDPDPTPNFTTRTLTGSVSVILLCFSLRDRDTFECIRTKWHPELDHHAFGIPIVLVGVESGSGTGEPVTRAECCQLAREIPAVKRVFELSRADSGVQCRSVQTSSSKGETRDCSLGQLLADVCELGLGLGHRSVACSTL
eukprot:gnl/Spiro4/25591_TR12743_c0_g1_i1.p2 gnl/Spiro4/25591_TR12743_c0_g1~~gnl/Spiro4/25591_TR12743_c0_g1_i1.p2  ORF type:complete len:229 (-),score=58.06 gnl/Spiro4/25591_TR12743_c0_g1_i1:249-935(-)